MKYLSLWFSTICLLPQLLSAAPVRHHELDVKIIPSQNRIEATDKVTLPAPAADRGIILNTDLVRTVKWLDDRTVEVRYSGIIDYPLRQVGEEYARGQKDTAGSIGTEGVYLDGGTEWYPRIPGQKDEKITFDLSIALPAGWKAVSQGRRAETLTGDDGGTVTRWICDRPQDAIWLVAGQYREYGSTFGKFQAMAFFREPEDDLAGKYLEATGEYLRMYEQLIGPYPYSKFAVVENFWETGYGMPSFTLLGPRVIRFPFIIESSYPHEILHNWWGNSVYIDYQSGNWGEGLTAYLSDHLLKEQKGLGAQHRQEVLQKYADYVLDGRDIPLTAFRSRHGSVTEAVGYGKTLMMFHMLRLKLGDEVFKRGLRRLFRDNLYREAGFPDVKAAFEEESLQDLGRFFSQWVLRAGAPILELEGTDLKEGDERGFELGISLRQVQNGEPYELTVPVAVTLEGEKEARLFNVAMDQKRKSASFLLPARPVRVDVDPAFDLFRRLDRKEVPPALTQAFGARKAFIVLPADAPPGLLESYRALAEFLRRTGPGEVEIAGDAQLKVLPPDSSVWLLGWENRFLEQVQPVFGEYGLTMEPGRVIVGDEAGTVLMRSDSSVVLSGRHPANPDLAVLWIAADNRRAHPGLARKLPHYHKYSYLAFTGDEPVNSVKGRWPVVASPMTGFPDGVFSPMGSLRRQDPLVGRPLPFSADRMMEDIRYLSSDQLKGRGSGTTQADQAARYIVRNFEDARLEPGGDSGSWYQEFRAGEEETAPVLRNVVGIRRGTEEAWKGQSLVLGAHYDHLGPGLGEGVLSVNRGRIHPGADDNASGVAVLMELARVFAAAIPPRRSVVFAAFDGEEWGKLGSAHFLAAPGAFPPGKIMGMVNLDTVGRLGDRKLLILGGGSAAEWAHIFRGAGYVAGVDVQLVAGDLDASDQVSFASAGVPAVQLFTGPHSDYHRPSDTVDKIDARGLVKVAQVAKEAVEYLAGRTEPLTGVRGGEGESGGGPSTGSGQGSAAGVRKVSLGAVPDFTFEGEGVRLEGTVDGSPAAVAGLRRGDVLTAMNGTAIKSLRDLSDMLKNLGAGDRVKVEILRDETSITVEAVLEER